LVTFRAVFIASLGATMAVCTGLAEEPCWPEPATLDGASPSCSVDAAYLLQRMSDAPHPTLYKALVAAELRCSLHAKNEKGCLMTGDRCSWSPERGCEAWAAVSGFGEAVAVCSEAKGFDYSHELALQASVAAECETYHDSLSCEAAMDGLCSWKAKLGFSREDTACQAISVPFMELSGALRTEDCDTTAASELALLQYRSAFERCTPLPDPSACRQSASGCAWRGGLCMPSVALLVRPLALVGPRLAQEVTSCEGLSPTLDGLRCEDTAGVVAVLCLFGVV